MQRYKGNISELELYFVILNNEYGERTEEELLPGGKDMRVTNENVITFIHLVSNHRLNFQVPALSLSFILALLEVTHIIPHFFGVLQIRQQSSHFLRGFQQLIPKESIDMFNEHELQVPVDNYAPDG